MLKKICFSVSLVFCGLICGWGVSGDDVISVKRNDAALAPNPTAPVAGFTQTESAPVTTTVTETLPDGTVVTRTITKKTIVSEDVQVAPPPKKFVAASVFVNPVLNQSSARPIEVAAVRTAVVIRLQNSGYFKVVDAVSAAEYQLDVMVDAASVDERAVRLNDVTAAQTAAKVKLTLQLRNAATGTIIAAREGGGEAAVARTSEAGGSALGKYRETAIQQASALAAGVAVTRLMDLCCPIRIAACDPVVGTLDLTVSGERVKPGDCYEIIQLGGEIKNPATGVSLGFVEKVAAEVEIVRVQPLFATGRVTCGAITAALNCYIARRIPDEVMKARQRQADAPRTIDRLF